MIKYLLLLMVLFTTSCVSTSHKEFLKEEEFPACFVKWEKMSDKVIYQKAHGLSLEEKIEQNLNFDSWNSGGVLVGKKINDTDYVVIYDFTEVLLIKKLEEIEKMFYEPSPRMFSPMATSAFVVSEKQLKKDLSGYDRVDCKELSEIQRN